MKMNPLIADGYSWREVDLTGPRAVPSASSISMSLYNMFLYDLYPCQITRIYTIFQRFQATVLFHEQDASQSNKTNDI